jgi:hypothetical protein
MGVQRLLSSAPVVANMVFLEPLSLSLFAVAVAAAASIVEWERNNCWATALLTAGLIVSVAIKLFVTEA